MAQAKITLIGLENYLNPERSVFQNIMLPNGIDKDILIGAIILRCQEFELLYSDPDFLIDAVNIWSRKNYWTFDKWIKALNIQYDPLYNYDRTEEYTDTHSGNYNKNGSGNSSGTTGTTNNLTETHNLHSTNDVTNTHSEKAFNDSSLVNNQTDVVDQDGSDTGTITNTGTVTGTYSNNDTNTEAGTDGYTNIHKARLFGNIGVTTSQQMLQSELDIARWNLYEHIADLFASEFCIMVY